MVELGEKFQQLQSGETGDATQNGDNPPPTFEDFDRDGGGALDKAELEAALAAAAAQAAAAAAANPMPDWSRQKFKSDLVQRIVLEKGLRGEDTQPLSQDQSSSRQTTTAPTDVWGESRDEYEEGVKFLQNHSGNPDPGPLPTSSEEEARKYSFDDLDQKRDGIITKVESEEHRKTHEEEKVILLSDRERDQHGKLNL